MATYSAQKYQSFTLTSKIAPTRLSNRNGAAKDPAHKCGPDQGISLPWK